MWEAQYAELSRTAAGQSGLITATQLNRLGVAEAVVEHFVSAGLLVELDWAVYQLSNSVLAPRYAYPLAAWLAISPDRFRWERPVAAAEDAVLSHDAAANLQGLGSIPFAMVFTAPAPRQAPRATTIHVGRLDASEVMLHGEVPVTTPHRTILDLVRAGATRDELQGVVTDAVRRDLVDLRALHDDLAPLAGEHAFPAGGADFVRHFLPDLRVRSLSPRNLRALAGLVAPDRVAELRDQVLRVMTEAGVVADTAEGTDHPVSNEALGWDVAAEIVGRSGLAGRALA